MLYHLEIFMKVLTNNYILCIVVKKLHKGIWTYKNKNRGNEDLVIMIIMTMCCPQILLQMRGLQLSPFCVLHQVCTEAKLYMGCSKCWQSTVQILRSYLMK